MNKPYEQERSDLHFIEHVGWSPVWQNAFARHGDEFAGAVAARIIREDYGAYKVITETGERFARSAVISVMRCKRAAISRPWAIGSCCRCRMRIRHA